VPKEIPVITRLHLWFHPKPGHQRLQSTSRAGPGWGRLNRRLRLGLFGLGNNILISGLLVGGHVRIAWLRSSAVVWCRWCVTTGRGVRSFWLFGALLDRRAIR
jgi:hypothetical protein